MNTLPVPALLRALPILLVTPRPARLVLREPESASDGILTRRIPLRSGRAGSFRQKNVENQMGIENWG